MGVSKTIRKGVKISNIGGLRKNHQIYPNMINMWTEIRASQCVADGVGSVRVMPEMGIRMLVSWSTQTAFDMSTQTAQ